MSNTNKENLLCKSCQEVVERTAGVTISQVQQSMYGVFITRLTGLHETSEDNCVADCRVCRLLDSMVQDTKKHLSSAISIPYERYIAEGRAFELRAISFLRFYGGINYDKLGKDQRMRDTVNLVVLPEELTIPDLCCALQALFWKRGHVLRNTIFDINQDSKSIAARIVPPNFDPSIVKGWLQHCESNHTKLCPKLAAVPGMRIIDCHTREIVLATVDTKYVALSYVWGPQMEGDRDEGLVQDEELRRFLPQAISNVVADAMKVNIALGFRFLWVDKYCIDQTDLDKHLQIRQMNMIYMGSSLTIIQATGEGQNSGLPGVGSSLRHRQPVVDCGDFKLISTMSHPHEDIKKSMWMTRGWTFQEAILPCRRLVFTEDQVYFECNSMNCFEALRMPVDLTHTKRRDRFRSFMRGGLFSGRDEGLDMPIFGDLFEICDDKHQPWSHHFRKYLVLATNYTSRSLSFDSDSLNAFVGIMTHFEKLETPIHQFEGIPYVLRGPFIDDRVHLDSVVAGLCWRHLDCIWTGGPSVRRRKDFASWCWAGWAGAVSWTDVFTSKFMDMQSLLDDLHCGLQNGTFIPLDEYEAQNFDGNRRIHLLRFRAWLVPPEMISLRHSEGTTAWSISGFELKMHISAFDGRPEDFGAALTNGRVQCLYVGKGDYNSYFLFVRSQGVHAIRIGTGEAEYFSNDCRYYRFAEEVHFEASKIEICLA